MKKRYFAIIAGIMLSASIITGCGGRQETGSQREAELEAEISELHRQIDELRSEQDAAAKDQTAGTVQENDSQRENRNETQNETDSGSRNQTGSGNPALSLEEARDIALARVDGAGVENISVELERDDGRCLYEGEIFYNGMEYEFEIDANSGNILKWEQERW